MTGVVATLLFLALGAVLVLSHLRRMRRDEAQRVTAACEICPRCGGAIDTDRAICAGCGAPRGAFEIVTAPRALGAPPQAGTAGLHALVRADVCVGCGTCVDACPEEGAIRVEDKRALVDTDRCKAHGSCVSACPVGAIALSSSDSVQRVEVPSLDLRFESNVAGIFVVGELGGRGLIKNAINEGRLAVEAIAKELRDTPRRPNIFDLVIAGAGPAGLSAALEAKRQRLRAVVLERGTVADSIRKYPRHKLLLAEPMKTSLYGQLWVADASKEDLLSVWERTIADERLDIRPFHEVTHVERVRESFAVSAGGTQFFAQRVVLALGRRGNPRRLGVPGEELEKTFYDIAEMEQFAGRKVIVVGGGDSAIESALGLAHQPGSEVILSYRGDEFRRVKPRNLEKLQASVSARKLRVLLRSELLRIEPERALLRLENEEYWTANDDVIIRIGGEPCAAFLQRIGIQMVNKDLAVHAY